jgi:hypothetical protein
MEQTGDYVIAAPRARVWDALNDPEVLKRCIEGCEDLTRGEDGVLHAVVRARVGPVSATFAGEVTLKEVDPPNGYTLEVNAKGGAAGFARGTARVSLVDAEGGTKLSYAAEGKVGGKLAQIGQRLIDAAARKTADDFFEAFTREVAPPAPADTVGAGIASPPARRGVFGGPIAWGVAAAAAIAAALLAWSLRPR